jgi:hypothetical protein
VPIWAALFAASPRSTPEPRRWGCCHSVSVIDVRSATDVPIRTAFLATGRPEINLIAQYPVRLIADADLSYCSLWA